MLEQIFSAEYVSKTVFILQQTNVHTWISICYVYIICVQVAFQ